MNREIWLDVWEPKPCPNCKKGKLEYDPKRAQSTETRQSLIDNEFHRSGLIYPEMNYLDTAHLKCDKCGDVVTATFERTEDVRHKDEEGNEISDWKIILFYPALPIISLPLACPEKVRTLLEKSFGLYWFDQAACGNKIRVAIEALMDELGVLHCITNGSHISLGNRLKTFAKINPQVANYLEAIKWIGNSASHDDVLSKRDLLDAYELIDHSLELLYKEREFALQVLSNQINTNKGPIKR